MRGIFSARRRPATVLTLAIALVAGVTAAVPADAAPDTGFGTDGFAGFADIATPGSQADGSGADFSRVATGTDGKVTTLINGTTLLRTTASGTADPSFGTNGRLTVSPADHLAVDGAGSIALASTGSNQVRLLTATGATLATHALCGTGVGAIHAMGTGRWTVALLGCAPAGGVRMLRMFDNGALDDTYGDEVPPPPTTTTTTTTSTTSTTSSTTSTTEATTTTTEATTTTTEATTTTTEATTTTTEAPPLEAPPVEGTAQYGYVDLPANLGNSVVTSDGPVDGRVALALAGGATPTILVVTASGGVAASPAPFDSGSVRDLALAPDGAVTWVAESGGTVLKRRSGSTTSTSTDPALATLHSAHVVVDANADPIVAGTILLPSGTRHAAAVTLDGAGLTTSTGVQLMVGPISAEADFAGDLAVDRSDDTRVVVAASVHVAAPTALALGLFRFSGGVTRPNRPPQGAVPAVIATGPQTIRVTGWAIDPDTQLPLTVRITIDGDVQTPLMANEANNASLTAFPALGINHGYLATYGYIAPGSHRVCVEALDDLTGVATSLGCGDPSVPNGEPSGTLDTAPRIGNTDRILVGGTAFDPDAPNGPWRVHFYNDGEYAGEAVTNAARKWAMDVKVGYGYHTFCGFVINEGYGSNQPLGCLDLYLEAPPIDWDALGKYLEAVRAAQMKAFWAFVAFCYAVLAAIDKAAKAKKKAPARRR